MAIATKDAAPSHLLLKIESFSLFDKCQVDKYESPEFQTGNNKWKLTIYPNGHGSTERARNNVSVYLAISGTDDLPKNWEVNAVFSNFILDQISGNYHHTPGNTRRFFRLKTEWSVPNFMSTKDLMNPSNGYLINDCCVFGAEVFIIDNINVVTRCLSLKDVQVPYKRVIKISDYSKLKVKNWYSEEFMTAEGYKWKVRYTCMKNQTDSNKNRRYTSSRWFDASNISWGWLSFGLLDELNAASSGFIVNDACIYIFEIEIYVQAVVQ